MIRDPRMRLRLWVDAELVDETWIDCGNPDAEKHFDALMDRYERTTLAVHQMDRPWLIELYDPARPEHEAYTRFGSDTAGMTDPRPMS